MRTQSAWKRAATLVTVAGITLAAACSGIGLPSPSTELSTGNALIDLSDAIVSLRDDDANIQAQVDSLREVVARQDSLIRHLANLFGAPIQ